VNEEAACQQYLLDYLGADSTLNALLESGVWLRSVPQSARFPVVKIDRQDAEDLYVVGLHRVWSNLSFLVRGIIHWEGSGQPDWTDVRAIGDRLDALLHDHEAVTSELQVHSFREEPFSDESVESGDLFLHVGGIYRVRARAV
jgi:hypothetical protein